MAGAGDGGRASSAEGETACYSGGGDRPGQRLSGREAAEVLASRNRRRRPSRRRTSRPRGISPQVNILCSPGQFSVSGRRAGAACSRQYMRTRSKSPGGAGGRSRYRGACKTTINDAACYRPNTCRTATIAETQHLTSRRSSVHGRLEAGRSTGIAGAKHVLRSSARFSSAGSNNLSIRTSRSGTMALSSGMSGRPRDHDHQSGLHHGPVQRWDAQRRPVATQTSDRYDAGAARHGHVDIAADNTGSTGASCHRNAGFSMKRSWDGSVMGCRGQARSCWWHLSAGKRNRDNTALGGNGRKRSHWPQRQWTRLAPRSRERSSRSQYRRESLEGGPEMVIGRPRCRSRSSSQCSPPATSSGSGVTGAGF